MGGDAPGQTDMQHIEVVLPHIRESIKGESFITQAETAEQREDAIGDDSISAILAEKVIGYVGKLILGWPPSNSLSQLHCGSQAE